MVGKENRERVGGNMVGASVRRRGDGRKLERGPGGVRWEDAGGYAAADVREASGGRLAERKVSGVLVARRYQGQSQEEVSWRKKEAVLLPVGVTDPNGKNTAKGW